MIPDVEIVFIILHWLVNLKLVRYMHGCFVVWGSTWIKHSASRCLHLRWPITIGWVFGNHDHNHGINFELSLVTRRSTFQAFGIYRDHFKFHPNTSLNWDGSLTVSFPTKWRGISAQRNHKIGSSELCLLVWPWLENLCYLQDLRKTIQPLWT